MILAFKKKCFLPKAHVWEHPFSGGIDRVYYLVDVHVSLRFLNLERGL